MIEFVNGSADDVLQMNGAPPGILGLKILFWWYKIMDPHIQAYAGGSSLIRQHLSEDFDTFWALMQNIRELAVQQKIASVNDRPSKRRTVFSSSGLFFLVIQLLPVTTSGIQDRRHAYC